MTISANASAPLPTTLHIGMAKAGSSTIQGVLQTARETLAAQGILYPRDLLPNGSTGGDNQKCLAVCNTREADHFVLRQHRVRNPQDRARFNQRVTQLYTEQIAQARAAGAGLCLLSAEHFWSSLNSDRELGWLANKLRDVGLRVDRLVFYIRSQSDWLESKQHQSVREGAEPLDMSIAALKAQPFYQRLPHDHVAALWQAAFPDARFELRLFDSRDFVKGDLMSDFKAAAGLDADLPAAPQREQPVERRGQCDDPPEPAGPRGGPDHGRGLAAQARDLSGAAYAGPLRNADGARARRHRRSLRRLERAPARPVLSGS
ncbi:hypothetical protein [Salipiger aestuarii]|uniref:hypothetical protein n=1 Tax=Salipiger aestuarii TaxID=568098 RepID=UPI0012387253|nr:hypothetical protein [Salipiger aestuarii]KAA8610025.1 hypothetical protein AL037_14325 [Salipiger aestuarii]